mmetsp:Transcript_7241/g.8299  ORF Transcript_7241/g.8299 Transcript_7241/m.8299 type:complete len:172 (+) Transcript_7241:120-635(+)
MLYILHYTNRSIFFTLKLKAVKPTPIVILCCSNLFLITNGYLQVRYLSYLKVYDEDWIYSPQCVFGSFLFLSGLYINSTSDTILTNLRQPGEVGYKIPHGGLFEYVSGANYFGEIVEWFGFGLATLSLPGITFAVCTLANIGPRAIQHHQWYLKKFENYPKKRKALIPFIF